MVAFAVSSLVITGQIGKITSHVVPDKPTAIAIGTILLSKRYGNAVIANERPLTARFDHGIWTVEGTMPKGMLGGVASVRLRAKDCQVLSMIHGK